jgi:hypothetical protein
MGHSSPVSIRNHLAQQESAHFSVLILGAEEVVLFGITWAGSSFNNTGLSLVSLRFGHCLNMKTFALVMISRSSEVVWEQGPLRL